MDIALAVGLTLAALASAVLVARFLPGAPILALLLVQGLIVLAGLERILRRRGQPWRSLGLARPTPHDVVRALLALGAVLAVNLGFELVLAGLWPGAVEAHMRRIVRLAEALAGDAPFAALALSMLFVGFYEELLARGLLLQRCRSLFSGVAGRLGSVWLPVLASSALFGIAHGYQGGLGIVQTGLIGVVLALLTLRWGTLWPAILAHAMLNAGSLMLARRAFLETAASW